MTWTLGIDFSGNADFTGAYDDVTQYVTGTLNAQRGIMSPDDHVADETELSFMLNNDSRLFSPEYVSGALYGKLKPNRMVRLLLDSTVLFTGWVEAFEADTLRYGSRMCRVRCKGMKRVLQSVTGSARIFENQTADEIISEILLNFAVPDNLNVARVGSSRVGTAQIIAINQLAVMATGSYTIPIAGHNPKINKDGTTDLYSLIADVCEVERGYFVPLADGRWRFFNRFDWLGFSTALTQTLDNDFTSAKYSTPDRDTIVTKVQVKGYLPQRETSVGLIWESPQDIVLAANEERTIYIDFRNPDEERFTAEDIQEPTGGDVVFDAGDATLSLTSEGLLPFGGIAISVKIEAGSSGCTISTLNIRGKKIKTKSFQYVETNVPLKESYGDQTYKLDVKLLSDIEEARNRAKYELAERSTEAGIIQSVTLERGLDEVTTTSDVIVRDIGDLIRIIDDQTGHDSYYRITAIIYRMQDYMLVTTWQLKRVLTDVWAIVGFSRVGINRIIG